VFEPHVRLRVHYRHEAYTNTIVSTDLPLRYLISSNRFLVCRGETWERTHHGCVVQFVTKWVLRAVTNCLQPATFHLQLVDAHLLGGRTDTRSSNMANSAFIFLIFSFLFSSIFFFRYIFCLFFVFLTYSGGGKGGVENTSLLDPKHQGGPFCLQETQVQLYI
jgi:hypothetical protein